MKNAFLMVRNFGVFEKLLVSLIGASTSRGNEAAIGQFGSGRSFAIALLLRLGIRPILYAGTLKIEVFTNPQTTKSHTFNRVCFKFSGKDENGVSHSTIEKGGFCDDYGAIDWTDPFMALREFVSNAIDGATENGGSYKDIQIEIVSTPRAKAGHTSVFIPYTPEIEEAYGRLASSFLHLGNPTELSNKLLEKVGEGDEIRCFKKGVMVCKLDGHSVFDYNFGDELEIDESRNAKDYAVRSAAATAIADATPSQLHRIFSNLATGEEVFEARLNSSTLGSEWEGSETKNRRAANWQQAWKSFAGDNAVACSYGLPVLQQFIERKGFRPVALSSPSFLKALKEYGITTEFSILDINEQKGKELMDATPEMQAAVDWAWKLCEDFKMLNGKEKPPVRAFKEIMKAEAVTLGFYDTKSKTVYLNMDLGEGFMMRQTAMEELVHHLSQATDNSRDFQDFILRLITEIAS